MRRYQQVLAGWAEPGTCAGVAHLRQRLAEYARVQRADYSACQGRTRLDAFPELLELKHPYRREQDQSLWSREQALDYVTRFTFTRKVERNGRLTLVTAPYTLGRAYQGQSVVVELDPATCEWVVKDRHGTPLRCFSAQQLTCDTIASMGPTYPQVRAQPTVVSP